VRVSDKNKDESLAHSAGRGFGWLLEKLMGKGGAARLADSADVLREEFEAGKREGEEPPPRSIPHDVMDEDQPRGPKNRDPEYRDSGNRDSGDEKAEP
jgi:hypothetical protein